MYFLIAAGFWLVLVLLILAFFAGASRLDRQWHPDELLLTRQEREAQVLLFPTVGRQVMAVTKEAPAPVAPGRER